MAALGFGSLATRPPLTGGEAAAVDSVPDGGGQAVYISGGQTSSQGPQFMRCVLCSHCELDCQAGQRRVETA